MNAIFLKVLLVAVLAMFWVLVIVIQPAIALATGSVTPTTNAKEEVAPTNSYQADPNTKTISSEKVSQFVKAYLQVVALIDRRANELRRAETNAESHQIEQDIQAEAFKIIEQANLTRQEYLQLLGLANTDPDFRERVVAQLQEVSLTSPKTAN